MEFYSAEIYWYTKKKKKKSLKSAKTCFKIEKKENFAMFCFSKSNLIRIDGIKKKWNGTETKKIGLK